MNFIYEKFKDLMADITIGLLDKSVNIADSREYNAISQEKLNEAFLFACEYRSVEDVKRFFINPHVKKIPNINVCEGLALRKAVIANKVNTVDFLLTSPQLAEHICITEHIFSCLKMAKKKRFHDITNYFKQSEKFFNFLIEKEKRQLKTIIEQQPVSRKNTFKI